MPGMVAQKNAGWKASYEWGHAGEMTTLYDGHGLFSAMGHGYLWFSSLFAIKKQNASRTMGCAQLLGEIEDIREKS